MRVLLVLHGTRCVCYCAWSGSDLCHTPNPTARHASPQGRTHIYHTCLCTRHRLHRPVHLGITSRPRGCPVLHRHDRCGGESKDQRRRRTTTTVQAPACCAPADSSAPAHASTRPGVFHAGSTGPCAPHRVCTHVLSGLRPRQCRCGGCNALIDGGQKRAVVRHGCAFHWREDSGRLTRAHGSSNSANNKEEGGMGWPEPAAVRTSKRSRNPQHGVRTLIRRLFWARHDTYPLAPQPVDAPPVLPPPS